MYSIKHNLKAGEVVVIAFGGPSRLVRVTETDHDFFVCQELGWWEALWVKAAGKVRRAIWTTRFHWTGFREKVREMYIDDRVRRREIRGRGRFKL